MAINVTPRAPEIGKHRTNRNELKTQDKYIMLAQDPACGMRAALASLLDAHGASQPVSGETPPQASPVLVSGLTTGDRHTPRVQSRPVRVLSPPRPSARSRTAPAVPATVPQCGRPILLQRGCAHRVADVPYTVSVRMLYPGRARTPTTVSFFTVA